MGASLSEGYVRAGGGYRRDDGATSRLVRAPYGLLRAMILKIQDAIKILITTELAVYLWRIQLKLFLSVICSMKILYFSIIFFFLNLIETISKSSQFRILLGNVMEHANLC